MDLNARNLMLKSVEDGRLRLLKHFLQSIPNDSRKQVVNKPIEKKTLLAIAIKNGNQHIVEYLVEECSADIEMKCNIKFDNDEIEGAPPLWIAAASGYLNIVKYLVEKGAQVNSTTQTLSTPLRAACYDGHYNIVKYLIEHGSDINFTNRHGHTCLMISSFKGHIKIVRYLIRKGADVNKKSIRGYTAMHDCADAGHADVLKILIENGAAMHKDVWGITPLFTAAMAGRENIFKLIVSHDIKLELQGQKEKQLCSSIDKVNALEIMGATFVDKFKDLSKAVQFWRKALEIRNSEISLMQAIGEDLDKIAEFIKLPNQLVDAYENAVEFSSIEELDNIKNNPDALRMQALIIRERILGYTHPETLYYIRVRGAFYAEVGDLHTCFNLWLYALHLQQTYLEPLSPETEGSLRSFAELLSFMTSETLFMNLIDRIFVLLQKALHELKIALNRQPNSLTSTSSVHLNCCQNFGFENESGNEEDDNPHAAVIEEFDDDEDLFQADCLKNAMHCRPEFVTFDQIMRIILYFIGCLCRFRHLFTERQNHDLHVAVYQFVKLNSKGRDQRTPLHIACDGDIAKKLVRDVLCETPMTEVVRILIKCDADVNALDSNRNTPLHIACRHGSSVKNSIVRLLIDHGSAHLDFRNVNDQTPLQQISEWNRTENCKEFRPLKHTSLRCLCARVITKNIISYKQVLPDTLHAFVDAH